ncbi:hypothetical protein [Streptosporangium sp. CA-115845]|uniref:hypothetical protein n=1 Tax=Streptosporangium sp. CA-115845 TaxID=3240071 RepID=UPI003D949390
MSETALTLPGGAVSVAALVAAEYASHADHTRQRFAQDAARTLLAMRPAVHDEATNASAAALDAAARVVLMLAGLDTGQGRTGSDALAEVDRD